jgi:NAD-dependent SIR2 family protein deacetylase
MESELDSAAQAIAEADALLITAGAGMGVDSGLPDFRGDEGFWNAYPPYRMLGKSFVEMANPAAFDSDPAFAWGFYGHRLRLYRETTPHHGFRILLEWGQQMPRGSFVMTSNVDGHFEKAGFDESRIYEVHGSIHHLQCSGPCAPGKIWPAAGIDFEIDFEIDEATMRAVGELPRCPDCGRVARPNILMFGDGGYLDERNAFQYERLDSWLSENEGSPLAVVELGAGSAVPTVRLFSERVAQSHARSTLVRINPREPAVPTELGAISLSTPAGEALQRLDALVAPLLGS